MTSVFCGVPRRTLVRRVVPTLGDTRCHLCFLAERVRAVRIILDSGRCARLTLPNATLISGASKVMMTSTPPLVTLIVHLFDRSDPLWRGWSEKAPPQKAAALHSYKGIRPSPPSLADLKSKPRRHSSKRGKSLFLSMTHKPSVPVAPGRSQFVRAVSVLSLVVHGSRRYLFL